MFSSILEPYINLKLLTLRVMYDMQLSRETIEDARYLQEALERALPQQ